MASKVAFDESIPPSSSLWFTSIRFNYWILTSEIMLLLNTILIVSLSCYSKELHFPIYEDNLTVALVLYKYLRPLLGTYFIYNSTAEGVYDDNPESALHQELLWQFVLHISIFLYLSNQLLVWQILFNLFVLSKSKLFNLFVLLNPKK